MQFIKSYEEFVLRNASQVSGLESTLKSLTYLLPGRFHDSELASEALYTFANLMGLWHDKILARSARDQQRGLKGPSTQFNSFTLSMLKSSSLYQKIAYAITVVQLTEVLTEMVAQRTGGKKAKWNTITALEIVKALCRVALLYLSDRKMILHSQVPERDYDMSTLHPVDPLDDLLPPAGSWRAPRSGKNILSLSSVMRKDSGVDGLSRLLDSRALAEPNRVPQDLVPGLSSQRIIAEWMFILRPLVYVLAIRKYGRRSWKPWAISLFLELASFSASLDSKLNFRKNLSSLEKEEYRKRASYFLFYLLRNPCYEAVTRPKLSSVIAGMSKVPLISIAAGLLDDYKVFWESYYFYTSGY
ncbi:peroxisome membrane protein [Polychytrium aggregatum]|uniref:peroxisome membrane protein n=1 Tax=Polychytrium aggregatum TaxID=110093 RepID=UPI0022FEA921|nr:peroxisome membrane protein [Polychytrium aggregatum]KAI9202313.1 peroxisome membrane protein [Polychytrium aggregatum]